jgi:hypothetical protein
MDMRVSGSGDLVVRDSRPMRAMNVVMIASGGVVIASWAIRRPLVGVPLLLVLIALLLIPSRAVKNTTVATTEGISGIRVRVPRSQRAAWFQRHEVLRAVTPWEEIESLTVGGWGSLSQVRVRLTDGREADLDASAVTRRGLRKIASDVERLRPVAA